MSYFDKAFQLVIGSEGGYSNDSQDPGGETKYGISKRAYPNVDIAALTLEKAKSIYMTDYWTKAGCEGRPWTQAYPMFDAAVLQGIGVATHCAELAGQRKSPEWQEEFLAQRALKETESKVFPRFGHGWFVRLFRVLAQSLSTQPEVAAIGTP